MSYARILERVFSSKWAILPDRLRVILDYLSARHQSVSISPELTAILSQNPRQFAHSKFALSDTNIEINTEEEKAGAPDSRVDGIEIIEGHGILGKHLSAMEEMCAGGLSVDRLQEALVEAADDESVRAILLHLDTPGGVVTGIPETADLIRFIRETKPVFAYCDSLCASAGYWIASACDEIFITKSAEVGSVGVYSAYHDLTAAYAQAGVKVELFKDGIYKAAGFPGTSLTDEQKKEIQADIDTISALFKADVKAGRPAVDESTLQGQCYTGQTAIAHGLADYLVTSRAQTLTAITKTLAALAALP